MKKDNETRTLAKSFFGMTRMPSKWNGISVYSSAIVRVLKGDGNEYFVIQMAGKDGILRFVKDFEGMYPIVKTIDVYPVDICAMSFDGRVPSQADIEDKIDFLLKCDYEWIPKTDIIENNISEEKINDLCERVFRIKQMNY